MPRPAAATLAVAAVAFVYVYVSPAALVSSNALRGQFIEWPLPSNATWELFEVDITAANGDGYLDILSSNHSTRQVLWIANAKGGFRGMLTVLGLDRIWSCRVPRLPTESRR